MNKKRQKRDVAVYDKYGNFISFCSENRKEQLLTSNIAHKINNNSIQLNYSIEEKKQKKEEIIKKANRICYICGEYIPIGNHVTIDHVIPKSKNRKLDIPENMRCCCNRCNNDKKDILLSDYVKQIKKSRLKYFYIPDNQLKKLDKFAKEHEKKYLKEEDIV